MFTCLQPTSLSPDPVYDNSLLHYDDTVDKAQEYALKLIAIADSIDALHQAFFNASDHVSEFYCDDEHASEAVKGVLLRRESCKLRQCAFHVPRSV